MKGSIMFLPYLLIGNCAGAFVSLRHLSSPQSIHRASPADEDSSEKSTIPQLPPIGSSSFGVIPSMATAQPVSNVASEKFELQYTCKICETRNVHRVSRIAYRNGVVICTCKGCSAQHLIADNLGWHNYVGGFEGDSNIEEYMASRGMADEVNRVSEDVFELEKLLSKTGMLLDENGNTSLE